jgi:hypothetical protein
MHYFSCSGGPSAVSLKSTRGHITPNLCVLHSVGFAGRVMQSSASGTRNVDTLFFMLVWDCYMFDKRRVRRRYAELVFLHPVGSAGHVLHSCASGARNVDALFFMLLWDRYGFEKKRVGTSYAKLMFLHSL